MSAMELGWHKECLKNKKSHLERMTHDYEVQGKRLKELEDRVDFYKFQIEEAEKVGKGKFDRDRFRAKKS